jgi:hypothetical protein
MTNSAPSPRISPASSVLTYDHTRERSILDSDLRLEYSPAVFMSRATGKGPDCAAGTPTGHPGHHRGLVRPHEPGSAYVPCTTRSERWRATAGGWVHGGMGPVSRCLAEAARATGAEIRAAAPVRRVVVLDGRAAGVELADGTEVPARAGVSGAHPKTTYLDLVGGGAPPAGGGPGHPPVPDPVGLGEGEPGLGGAARADRVGRPGARRPPPGPHRHLPLGGVLERAWDEAKYGGTSSEPYIEAVFPTVHEPELAPEGKHIALCFTQFGAYELRGRTWEEEREAFGMAVPARNAAWMVRRDLRRGRARPTGPSALKVAIGSCCLKPAPGPPQSTENTSIAASIGFLLTGEEFELKLLGFGEDLT